MLQVIAKHSFKCRGAQGAGKSRGSLLPKPAWHFGRRKTKSLLVGILQQGHSRLNCDQDPYSAHAEGWWRFLNVGMETALRWLRRCNLQHRPRVSGNIRALSCQSCPAVQGAGLQGVVSAWTAVHESCRFRVTDTLDTA